MARQARVIVPGVPHHVTQRGNRREPIFLQEGDEAVYLGLMSAQLRRRGVDCWAYCPMPNHVHFILTPRNEAGLALAVGEAHRRYTSFIGARDGWTGHVFQGRFGSAAMDEDHLLAAFRYVALNPVKAGLARRAADWRWSSAAAHIAGRSTPHVSVEPALERIADFAAFVESDADDQDRWAEVLKSALTGRPVGAKAWIETLEARLGHPVSPQRRGPKPRQPGEGAPASGDLFGV
jgi:putative transposase